MKLKAVLQRKTVCLVFVIQLLFMMHAGGVLSSPVQFQDSSGNTITVKYKPLKVVSLVPSISEILFKISANDSLKGITYHTVCPFETSCPEIVGGFLTPSIKRIEKLHPDIIFYSNLQENVFNQFNDKNCKLINFDTNSLNDAYKNILLLGKIFDREKEATNIVNEIKDRLSLIKKKVEKIPVAKRKRVIRIMGLDPLSVPGDNSFQNEFIRAAGGICPVFNKTGDIITISNNELVKFNPQIIYACGSQAEKIKKLFANNILKNMDAVKENKIYNFPCDLTCRASVNTGLFVSWLASRIYPDEFSKNANLVFKNSLIKLRPLHIDLNYIKDTRIAYSHIHDFINKTLVIDFKMPMSIVSTLDGRRNGIESVGNHYYPPPSWSLGNHHDFREIISKVCKILNKPANKSSFLLTGADMDNLAIIHKIFKKISVYALVTAGVKSNSERMSKDKGNYYEPGTINIILLTNTSLTERAMNRVIITATEAKTAALSDMDIRSSYTPEANRATGTGTDNIIVVQGTGIKIDNTGGHSKTGELIAKAVYDGVIKAIGKQNGLNVGRNIFQRLKERRITVFDLLSEKMYNRNMTRNNQLSALEEILLEPRYASFIEASMGLSDDFEKGLFTDIGTYDLWCKAITEDIAGRKIETIKNFIKTKKIPVVLKMSLNALMNGIYYKIR